MSRIRAEASALMAAPAARIYAILADYRQGHPRILPRRYFSDLRVEHGGVGAGTLIHFRLKVLGSTRSISAEVHEPEPGRVLAETDLATGAVTLFLVKPDGDENHTRVTIATEWTSGGVRGWVERLLAPPMLRKIYLEELRNLAVLAARAT
jgi:hypothetical protein